MGINIGNKNNIEKSKFINNEVVNKEQGFFKTILSNVISNFIWYIMGLMLTGGITVYIISLFN